MTELQTVLLRQSSGETFCELDIQVHLTVWDLKLLIEGKCNIRALRQRLCYDMEVLTDECTFEAFNHTEQLVLSLTILRWSDAVRDVNEFGNAERSVCYYRYMNGLRRKTASEICSGMEFRSSLPQTKSSKRYITHLRDYLTANCELGLEETIKMMPTEILAVLTVFAGIAHAIQVVLSGDDEAQRKWPLVVMHTLELEYDEVCLNVYCTNEDVVECRFCDDGPYCKTCSAHMPSCSPYCPYSSKSSIFACNAENELALHSNVTVDFLDHRMRIMMLCDIQDYLEHAGPFRGEALLVQAVLCKWKNISNASKRLACLALNGEQLRIQDSSNGNDMMLFKIVEIHRSLLSYDPPRRFFNDMTRELTLRYGGRYDIDKPMLDSMDVTYSLNNVFIDLWLRVGNRECSCVRLSDASEPQERTERNIRRSHSRIKNQALRPMPVGFQLCDRSK